MSAGAPCPTGRDAQSPANRLLARACRRNGSGLTRHQAAPPGLQIRRESRGTKDRPLSLHVSCLVASSTFVAYWSCSTGIVLVRTMIGKELLKQTRGAVERGSGVVRLDEAVWCRVSDRAINGSVCCQDSSNLHVSAIRIWPIPEQVLRHPFDVVESRPCESWMKPY
jgi:hypothetical protein